MSFDELYEGGILNDDTQRLVAVISAHWSEPNDELIHALLVLAVGGARFKGWSGKRLLNAFVDKVAPLYPEMQFGIIDADMRGNNGGEDDSTMH